MSGGEPMKLLVTFFLVAPPVPPMLTTTFVVLVCVGGCMLLFDRRVGPGAVLPILVLQVFAAASGFGAAARRGHYDLMLTSGAGRVRVALAHWIASVAAGVAGWLALAAVEWALGVAPVALASGTCAAMFLVSTLPWALAVNIPRFAPSVGWLLVVVVSATLAPPGPLGSSAGPPPDANVLRAALAILIYPPGIVGRHFGGAEAAVLVPGLIIGATAVVLACSWIARADFPLEASQ